MAETLAIVELLLSGPKGWLILGIGLLWSVAFGYWTLRKCLTPRRTTHAYIGYGGRLDAKTLKEVEQLLSPLLAGYAKLGAIHQGLKAGEHPPVEAARRVVEVALDMERECRLLDDLNIAFPRDGDHRGFRGRIAEARADAQNLRHAANALNSRHGPETQDASLPVVMADLMACFSQGRPETSSGAVILDARGAKPRQAMALDGALPAQEFIDGQPVALASVFQAQQAATHGGNHFGLAANDPTLGAGWRQVGDGQRPAVGTDHITNARTERIGHHTLGTL
jgi:hypothetical protein